MNHNPLAVLVDPAIHTPLALRIYLTSRGWRWTVRPPATDDGDSYWDRDCRPVMAPGDPGAADYCERVARLVKDIAAVHGEAPSGIFVGIESARPCRHAVDGYCDEDCHLTRRVGRIVGRR